MPGNKSRYIVNRSHTETLKLWRIPEWFNINQYDCVKKWTATRWLIEINFRRKVYTNYDGKQPILNFNKKVDLLEKIKLFYNGEKVTIPYFDNKEDWHEAIKSLYNNITKPVQLETRNAPAYVVIQEGEKYHSINAGIKNLKQICIELTENRGEEYVLILDLVRPHDTCRIFLNKYYELGTIPVVIGAEVHDLFIDNSKRSIISVDLNAPNAAIEEAFHIWLEEEKKKRSLRQHTSKMGRPPSSVGPQQFQIWARDRYLAYFDMLQLIRCEENLPDPDYNEWLILLDLLNKDFNLEKAEWLLSDDANGFLRAAAQREGYRLE